MKKKEIQNKVYELVKKIPKGKVTTYKEIGIVLNISPRLVGKILNKNENLKEVPCYKVVNSNGKVGGYSLDIDKKILLLKKDGIKIKNNKINNFSEVVFRF